MTQWDYLRAFHAKHPELGALESVDLRYFNTVFRKLRAARPKQANIHTYLGESRKAAAEAAERNTLEDYRMGRVRINQ